MQTRQSSSGGCIGHYVVIVAIPLVFLVALAAGYFGFLPLKVETHTFVIVAFIFIVFLLFVRHNANFAICIIRGSITDMEDALHSALRTNALTIMGKTKSTLGIREFFEQYYKAVRNENFAGVAPSVFPMLGILGTFIAIAISMPDFTLNDTQTLDREISILLAGIGTAFYASIYGILLSLVWIYFEKRGLSKAENLIHDMENLYDARIWKKSELIKHEHMQSELKDHEMAQAFRELFNPDAIKDLNEHYITAFTEVITETSKHFETFTKQMQEATLELRTTLESLQDKTTQQRAAASMERNLEAFIESSRRLDANLRRFDQEFEHALGAVDRELSTAIGELGKMVQILSEQNRQILESLNQHHPKEV